MTVTDDNPPAQALPADVLSGLPLPRQGRWRPLRAGIVGVFRYDVQELVFYNGRLLLRGANGNGKSMALEVLLPYLLDADMSPERLSTFGGRSRGMYTWLIGHDKNGSKETARGYVWIEFGRLDADGNPEFFTAGAGLEATRTTKTTPGPVTAWYFTTTARFGVELHAFARGTEPPKKDTLAKLLADAETAGHPGRIRKPADHRAECNRVLYGLDSYKYEALRKALTQLRRPKLSDQLSENALAAILRDALAPMDESLIAAIADGYERLDRHREDVDQLGKVRTQLGWLERVYGDYARSELHHRAKNVKDLEAVAAKQQDKATALAADVDSREQEITRQENEAGHQRTRRAELTGTLEGLRSSEAYREGKDLEPLAAKAAAQEARAAVLKQAAQDAKTRADNEQARAGDLAGQAGQAAANLVSARAAAAAQAARAVMVTAADADLFDSLAAGSAEDWLPAFDRDDAQIRIDEAVTDARGRLHVLRRLADEARAAEEALSNAAGVRADAEGVLEEATEAVATAEAGIRTCLEEHLDGAVAWIAGCRHLILGESAPELDADTVERGLPAWARRAERARSQELAGLADELSLAATAHSALDADLRRAAGTADTARAARSDASDARRDADTADQQWRTEITEWLVGAADLQHRSSRPVPPLAADPEHWTTWLAGAGRAHRDACTAELGMLHAEHTAVTEQAAPLLGEQAVLGEELDTLQSGVTAVPPAPHTRADSRTGRPGASLFTLVDFRGDDVNPRRAALLEAAMVAAGIADAWVSPDGQLITAAGDPLLDEQLVLGGDPVATPLSGALIPDTLGAEAAGIPIDVIAALLDRIALAETHASAEGHALAVAWDGGWRCGLLHGAHTQQHAHLIGAARRERARRERIAEIESELRQLHARIEPLHNRLADIEGQQQALRDALTAADAHIENFPTSKAMTDAAAAAALAEQKATTAASAIAPEIHNVATSAEHLRRTCDRATAAAAIGHLPESDPAPTGVAAPAGTPAAARDLIDEFDKIADLERRLLGDTAEQLEAAAHQLQSHRDALAAEARRMPKPTGLEQARAALTAANATEQSARVAVARATTRETEVRNKAAGHKTACDAAFAEAGLSGRQLDLAGTDQAVAAWHTAAITVVHQATTAHDLAERARTCAESAAELHETAQVAADHAKGPAAEAAAARAEYEAAHRRLSTAFEDVEQEIEQTQSAIEACDTAAGKLDRSLAVLRVAFGKAQSEAATALQAAAELHAKKPAVAESLFAAIRARVHESAGWTVPELSDLPPDRAPSLAAQILEQAGDARLLDPEAAVNITTQARHQAEPILGSRIALVEHWSDGLFLLSARRGGTAVTLHAAAQDINSELIVAETVIQREEAELLEQFLTADVRRQVTARIAVARAQNKAMNDLMKTHGTSSGVQVQLNWVPDKDSGGFGDDVLDLLDAEFDASPTSKTRLTAFFDSRIKALRAQHDGRGWRELLAEMLDYRRWYRYEIAYRRSEGDKWTRMSSADHNALSGGEKSVALHLPLFAAAANHTAAATVRDTTDASKPGCPRLILLDEVFAGISEDNRGHLFDLVSVLDMDLIATSEAETGMYSELDGIAIYHLVKHQSLPGILAVRSVWDGVDSHDLLDIDMDRDEL